MLGHKSAAMTLDVYADLFDDDLTAVADRLDDAVRASVVSKMWPEALRQRRHLARKRPRSPEIRASSEGGTRTRDTTIMSRVLDEDPNQDSQVPENVDDKGDLDDP